MKRIAIPGALIALVLGAPQAQAAVTAADLYARCKAERTVCGKAFSWNEENTSACLLAGQTDKAMLNKTIAWLKTHPKQGGRDDNEVMAYAIGALWPCR